MTTPPDPNQPPPGWGAPQPAGGWGLPSGPPQARGTNGFAIAGIICAFLCSPLGLIFGLVAKSQIKSRGGGGSGLATVAIVLSSVFIAIFVIAVATGHGSFSFHVGSDGSDG